MWYDTIRKGQKMFRVCHNRNLKSCDEERDCEQLITMYRNNMYPREETHFHWFFNFSPHNTVLKDEIIQVKKSCKDKKRAQYKIKLIHQIKKPKMFTLTPNKWSPAHKNTYNIQTVCKKKAEFYGILF